MKIENELTHNELYQQHSQRYDVKTSRWIVFQSRKSLRIKRLAEIIITIQP